MKPIILFSLAFAVISFSSCTAVTCRQPVGETPAELKEEEWNGLWMTKDGDVIFVTVSDADKGELEAAWMEREEGKAKLKTLEVLMRRSGDWLIFNAKEKATEPYNWGRAAISDGHLLLWIPESKAFKAAVKEKKLDGVIPKNQKGEEGNDVVLNAVPEKDLEAIREGRHGQLFNWATPLVFSRTKAGN